MRYHSWQPCTACRTSTGVPELMEVGGLVICTACGHVMVTWPGWVLADLTRDEAEAVRRHPNFARIRQQQERVVAGLWG